MRAHLRDVGGTLSAAFGDDAQDFREVLRLVGARRGLQGFRSEVGCVGLEEQALVRDVAHEFAQARTALRVADPACDADVQPFGKRPVQRVAIGGKAVPHAAREFGKRFFENTAEIGKGVTLVEKERFLHDFGNFQLVAKAFALVGGLGKAAPVIKAGFSAPNG